MSDYSCASYSPEITGIADVKEIRIQDENKQDPIQATIIFDDDYSITIKAGGFFFKSRDFLYQQMYERRLARSVGYNACIKNVDSNTEYQIISNFTSLFRWQTICQNPEGKFPFPTKFQNGELMIRWGPNHWSNCLELLGTLIHTVHHGYLKSLKLGEIITYRIILPEKSSYLKENLETVENIVGIHLIYE